MDETERSENLLKEKDRDSNGDCIGDKNTLAFCIQNFILLAAQNWTWTILRTFGLFFCCSCYFMLLNVFCKTTAAVKLSGS